MHHRRYFLMEVQEPKKKHLRYLCSVYYNTQLVAGPIKENQRSQMCHSQFRDPADLIYSYSTTGNSHRRHY